MTAMGRIGLLGMLAFTTVAHAVRLNGVLADPDFPAPGVYRLELLETGDTLLVRAGAPFVLQLPRDTVWTLCVRKGLAPQTFEKCLEVHHAGRDTVFSAVLRGTGILVAEPGAVAAAPDTTDPAAELAEIPAAAAEEDAVRLQKVVLRAQRVPKRAMGRETVSAKLIKRMPSLGEADVIRSIQGLPGVVASSDFSTKIYVRGGGSDQNLILFDNAAVFSPTHFFGLFSTFLVEGVEDVTFYKSGFPPEYGNRLSSVLDVKSRRGGRDTVDEWLSKSSLKISTFATQAHTEGHQGKVRWLFAGRTTYIKQVIDYLREQGVTDLTLDYYFYDLQGSLAVELGEGRELMVSMYQGRDKLNFDPLLIEWGNTVVPLNLKWRYSNVLESRTTLSYSLLSQSFGLASIFELYNNIASLQARHVVEYSGIGDHRLSTGIAVERSNVVFRNSSYVAGFTQRDERNFVLTSVFAQDKWTPGPAQRWEFSPGVRVNYMSTLNAASVEPRFTIKRQLPANQMLEFHTGRYVQYVNSIQFSDQESLNEFYYPAQEAKYRTVEPATSWLFALGYSRDRIFDQFTFSLEAYYKTLEHLLISSSTSEVPDSIANDPDAEFGDFFKEAEGYSYGYETSLRKPNGFVFGGISYSSGTSVIREQYYDEAYYPKWHQPHSLKIDLGMNWIGADGLLSPSSRNKAFYFRSSTQIKYATGLPYTETIGHQPGHLIDQGTGGSAGGPNPTFEENVQTSYGNYNASFVPSYFRWDVKPLDVGKEGRWNLSLTMLNVTNHPNVFFYSYDREKNPPERITVTQFPFFPVLISAEIYF
jgi:hypothetical protein